MKCSQVMKMDAGTVVCDQNGAVITIATKNGETTFHPSVPAATPVLPASSFERLYQHKTFSEHKPAKADKPAA